MSELIYCPLCDGPATTATNWRGDRIGECAAYRPCLGGESWHVRRDPYRWNVDRRAERAMSLLEAEQRVAAWREAAA